mmetsp:Transcript_23797/g.36151  ORF Transcript_23797/g.36151 Transcript_23797/m.36151 type:complete len:102 (+) Transcript_23797:358-663(+)
MTFQCSTNFFILRYSCEDEEVDRNFHSFPSEYFLYMKARSVSSAIWKELNRLSSTVRRILSCASLKLGHYTYQYKKVTVNPKFWAYLSMILTTGGHPPNVE